MCLGVPARVIRVEDNEALVAVGSVEYKASLLLLEDIKEGDYIILHAGFAIEKVDPVEAGETLKLFLEIEKDFPE
ncbi:MAG: HypC/HybG/HupF family hydrogenase formation chaperone [Bacteroidetes bacterium]|nr:HypC/HybG/HupF family hydrogenase formation chaperone [Bacteroidota bacterium]